MKRFNQIAGYLISFVPCKMRMQFRLEQKNGTLENATDIVIESSAVGISFLTQFLLGNF